jgi:hypothetical protein
MLEWGLVLAMMDATAMGPRPPSLRCPPEMALVDHGCIDRWEDTLVVMRGGLEVPLSPHLSPDYAVRYVAVSRPNVVPQSHVSMSQAWLACKRASKRLCGVDEWIRACRGPDRTTWPYGKEHEPGKCTDSGRTAPLAMFFDVEERFENRNMNDARLNMVPNTVAKTGEAPACTNDFGAFDMVGNLHEWIDDGTMRGGFYLDDTTLGEGCFYATRAHSKVYQDYSTGFRCCADATVEVSIDPSLVVGAVDFVATL